MTESAHLTFKINKWADCLNVPPWPTGLRRLCFDPETVGSRPGRVGTQFFFHAHFQCFNFRTWCALLKKVP